MKLRYRCVPLDYGSKRTLVAEVKESQWSVCACVCGGKKAPS